MMEILLDGEFDPPERAAWLGALKAALPEAQWLDREAAHRRPESVRVAVVANPFPGSLQGLPRLALIQSLWAGVDRLLADPTLPAGVPIARMVDPLMNAAMAETALWAVLSLHRGFFRYARLQREARWAPHAQKRADEITVAVLGLGQMGRSAAQRLAAQGYRLVGWSRGGAQASSDLVSLHGDDALDPVLAAADVVINLLPLTPATRGFFDAARLAHLQPTASLVNLARGAHVVDADLLAALDAGRLRHAVLDVFHQEPLPVDHAFWRHPRVTVLPHAAAQTDPRSAALQVAASVRAWLAGQPVPNLVDRTRGY
jgi:glyoxylate/hydroxypyruvate reductase A